jgi:hypothetical protein
MIEQDAEDWALTIRHVTTAQPRVVAPGGKIYI